MMTPIPNSRMTATRPSQIFLFLINITHRKAPMAETRHRQVIKTGALSEESRPMIVVAAKMTTSRWSL